VRRRKEQNSGILRQQWRHEKPMADNEHSFEKKVKII
jgi:hypothetical protein